MKPSSAETIAKVLTEALPYIQRFSGKTIVIKYGGNAMVDEDLKSSFARDIVLLNHVGIKPVVIHGGGPQIGQALEKLGEQSQFIDGLRVTTKKTMATVEDVLCNIVNKEIVQLVKQHGGQAKGLSGKEHNLITAKRISNDLGHVGEITNITPHEINNLHAINIIPIIAPVGSGKDNETLNINADVVAGKIASALNAEKLILLTNTSGVKEGDKLLTGLDQKEIKTLIANGVIKDGMLPKVNCAWDAITSGVNTAHIIDGRVQHAVLLELFTDQGVGTLLSS